MAQAGLAETVVQSPAISPLVSGLQYLPTCLLWEGIARMPGFVERLETELRALTPAECKLRVCCPDEYVSN